MNKNDVARRCALRLFQNSEGETANRLMLVGPNGRDLGGWGIGPLMTVVAEEIERARQQERRAKQREARKAK